MGDLELLVTVLHELGFSKPSERESSPKWPTRRKAVVDVFAAHRAGQNFIVAMLDDNRCAVRRIDVKERSPASLIKQIGLETQAAIDELLAHADTFELVDRYE